MQTLLSQSFTFSAKQYNAKNIDLQKYFSVKCSVSIEYKKYTNSQFLIFKDNNCQSRRTVEGF